MARPLLSSFGSASGSRSRLRPSFSIDAAIDSEKWPYEISERSRMIKILRPWLLSVGLRIQMGFSCGGIFSHTRTSVRYSDGTMYDSGKKEKIAPCVARIRRRLRSRQSFFVMPIVFGK